MSLVLKAKRAIRKPPHIIAKRLYQEASARTERYLAPQRIRRLTLARLLNKTKQQSLQQLWLFLSKRPYVSETCGLDVGAFDACGPDARVCVLERAASAMKHQVNLLGSGCIDLGTSINWHKDYKTGHDWPRAYMRDIDYNNLERPSDVKFPWELSRMQWLIPVGQAYVLTQDVRYAEKIKALLLDWVEQNPYAYGVNWACTMDVALRMMVWTWFFHVFKASEPWQDEVFQQKFLTSLYLHADFTERHLEFSDVNGNHYTADAAGLVFVGLFFGEGEDAGRWQHKGWDILCHELPRQVFEDGVDFEASVPYHRLVLELFFLPARYRDVLNLTVPEQFKKRLLRMAEFSVAYTQPDGGVPYWGDADDARVLPLGNQAINDHRYLSAYVGYALGNEALVGHKAPDLSEHFWMYGAEAVRLIQAAQHPTVPTSVAFQEGGFYIMQNASDHVFIDCGPLGLAGRGGHGHNDCLAFEAVLRGEKLVSDCGAYLYTASPQDRNLFRSTAYHNTPCVDGAEINRFIRWDYLWNMHDDAKPRVLAWQPGAERDYFCGSHTGYERLKHPVVPKRAITLEHQTHRLMIQDDILCEGQHEVMIPLHLAEGVTAELQQDRQHVLLHVAGKQFTLAWEGSISWKLQLLPARVSPSYGVFYSTQKLVWYANVEGNSQLRMVLSEASF